MMGMRMENMITIIRFRLPRWQRVLKFVIKVKVCCYESIPGKPVLFEDIVDIVDILMIIDIVLVCVQLYRADSSGSVWERVYYCGYEPSFNILCVGIDI